MGKEKVTIAVDKRAAINEKVVGEEPVSESVVPTAKEKKGVSQKKVAETKASIAEDKAATRKKDAKIELSSAEKKVVTDEKVSKKITHSAKKKLVDKEKTGLEAAEPLGGEWSKNPMLKPRIEKVTVNMSVGQSGKPLEQAATILRQLTNQNPSRRQAKKTIREFGIRKGESIACLVTLRKKKAEEFLRKALQAVENKLSKYCFDNQGNFSFGIKEHIDIPGTKYMPELGIVGMDVSVSLGRAGYRVKRRHRAKSRIGKDHLLNTDEAVLFIKDEFDVEII